MRQTWPRNAFASLVRDNGPGIVKQQIPNVFGKLLYGSKFHRLKMSRGQQGIGISAAGMYGLLTTGKSIKHRVADGGQEAGPLATRSRSIPRRIRPGHRQRGPQVEVEWPSMARRSRSNWPASYNKGPPVG